MKIENKNIAPIHRLKSRFTRNGNLRSRLWKGAFVFVEVIMGKDPAFLFYAGDYLRDTQCLSEKSQVAYDRIMCEHMRNICISQERLNFFTKRLSDSEKEELMSVLTPINGGFQIEWVALSIENRRAYSESRRSNRQGKHKEVANNISDTHDSHMENEIENENTLLKKGDSKGETKKVLSYPELEEVKEYFESMSFPKEEAESFFNHYSSQGWIKANGLPVSKTGWKATAQIWHKNQIKRNLEEKEKKNGTKSGVGSYEARLNYKPDLSDYDKRIKELKAQGFD